VGADDDAKEQEEDDDGRWRSYPGESARLPPRRCWWPKGERQRRIHGVDDSVVAVMVVVDVVVVVVAADDAAANVVGTGDAGSAHAVEVGVAVAAVDPVDGLGLEEPAGGPVLVVVVVAAAAADGHSGRSNPVDDTATFELRLDRPPIDRGRATSVENSSLAPLFRYFLVRGFRVFSDEMGPVLLGLVLWNSILFSVL